MKIKALTIITIISLIFTLNSNVFAATSNDDSNELKQTQDNKQKLEVKVEDLDKQISDVIEKVDNNKHDMDKLANEMQNTHIRLDTTKNNLNLQQNLFNKRIKAMYIDGNTSYLEILLGSHNLGDFIKRIEITGKIIQYDNNILNNVKEEKEVITSQSENLNNMNTKLQQLKTSNETILANLSSNIKEEKNLLSQATAKEKQLIEKQREKELAAEKAKALADAEKAAAAAQQTTVSALSNSISIPTTGGPNSGSTVITVDATAYSDNGFTASGSMTTRNPNGYSTIAVDPRVIPLGTRVYVQGYGYAIAADTGGAIQGKIIDVFFPSDAEAESWGRKTVQVTILN